MSQEDLQARIRELEQEILFLKETRDDENKRANQIISEKIDEIKFLKGKLDKIQEIVVELKSVAGGESN